MGAYESVFTEISKAGVCMVRIVGRTQNCFPMQIANKGSHIGLGEKETT